MAKARVGWWGLAAGLGVSGLSWVCLKGPLRVARNGVE